jgi:hypothetical protein
MMRASLLVIAAWTAATVAEPVGVKQVAAPPADILSGVVAPPEPEGLGVRSRTALLPIRRAAAAANGIHPMPFHAHAARAVSVVILSKRLWHAELTGEHAGLIFSAASDRPAEQAGPVVFRADAALPPALGDADATRLNLTARTVGPMTLSISGENPEGFVLIDPGADITLYTHPTTLRRVVGEPYGLRPWLDNARITRATADIRDPTGETRTIEADPDGVLRFTPRTPGVHAVRVEVTGRTDAGLPITLTTQHLVHAAVPAPLDGPVRTVEQDGGLTIILPSVRQRTITAAEVWGLKDGVPTPVCWLARMCDGERTLALDLRWVALRGVDPATLELRRVRSHDTDSYSMVGDLASVTLPPLRGPLPPAPAEPTPDMLTGRPGAMSVESSISGGPSPRSVLPGHRLFLIHGYCSGGNPFPLADFPGGAAVFADPNQSRTHDAFAQTVLTQGAPMKSYGVVAHSQGGTAALHLSTFYWSGLDWSQGERLIQSVGTPYQGTPLAGDAAVLGSIFGSGCGSNADLDPAGAAAWLSLIPTANRAQVWYWTTSFTDRPFALDYCNFISGLLLADPEDGVVERSRAQLPGANNMGHTEGWCHTAGMRDPAQTTDAARNAEMNGRARR